MDINRILVFLVENTGSGTSLLFRCWVYDDDLWRRDGAEYEVKNGRDKEADGPYAGAAKRKSIQQGYDNEGKNSQEVFRSDGDT